VSRVDRADTVTAAMRERFYTLLSAAARHLGPGFFRLIARGIAGGYFFLFPRRTALSVRFYRTLYPDRRALFHYGCAWRQFQNFTSLFLDRHLLQSGAAIDFTFEGREHLLDALEQNRGGILLMSHLGNWEMGAQLLRRDIPGLRLMLYVGQRAKDQIERLQKRDLVVSGVRVVAVDQEGGSAFDLVDGIAFLRSGGMVSMAGDLVWRPDQRSVPVRFLGHWVQLPEAPFMLALAVKVPLYVFFAAQRGRQAYHFSVSPPIHVTAGHRALRGAAIRNAAQTYADHLETQLRRCPYEWYHFNPFLGPAAPISKKL
jgi:predicted LPLAT superfamily acyltransferase